MQPTSAATTFRAYNTQYVNMLKLLRRQGGAARVLAGTDVGGIWVIPGFSLHQEFRELANEFHVSIGEERCFSWRWEGPEGNPEVIRELGLTQKADGTWVQPKSAALFLYGPAGEKFAAICATALEWLDEWGKCLECGQPFSREQASANRRFCGTPCKLAYHRRPEVKAVLMQHSESSTGVLHDVKGIAAVTRGTPAILIVDAVSSLGIADLQTDAWGVDVVVSGSQKGLMLPPGVSFCAVSQKGWGHVRTSRLPRYYFDFTAEAKSVAKGEAHFTPAVSIMLGLREVLRMLEAEGLANVFRRHDRLARATRAGVEALGLEIFAKATPSPALTPVVAPAGLDSEKILAAFSSSHNITIAGGQGEMKGKVFRLGHMGYVAEFDVITALAALEQVLQELGHPVDFGASVRAAQKVFAERG